MMNMGKDEDNWGSYLLANDNVAVWVWRMCRLLTLLMLVGLIIEVVR